MCDPPKYLSLFMPGGECVAWWKIRTLLPSRPPYIFIIFKIPYAIILPTQNGSAGSGRHPPTCPSKVLAATGPQSLASQGEGSIGQLPGNICPVHPEGTCSFPCGQKRGGNLFKPGAWSQQIQSSPLLGRWPQRRAWYGRPREHGGLFP